MKKGIRNYESPKIEILEIAIEKGFAISNENEEVNDVENGIWEDL